MPSITYNGGNFTIDGDSFIVYDEYGATSVPFGEITGVRALQDSPGSANVVVSLKDGRSRDFVGCKPMFEIDQLLTELKSRSPGINAGWHGPQVVDHRAALVGRITEYVMSGYSVVAQTETAAQLIKRKKFNTPLAVVLIIVGIVLAELPLLAYLVYYFTQKDEIVYLKLDANGQVIASIGMPMLL